MTSRKRTAADAWGAVLRVHAQLVPELDQVVQAEAGLPLSWYDVLLELAHAPEHRLRMTELGDRVVLSRTRVSRLVDELSSKGLVVKEADPLDGRSSFATLTDAGAAAFKAAAPIYTRAIEERFGSSLTTAELAQVADLLGRVLEARQ